MEEEITIGHGPNFRIPCLGRMNNGTHEARLRGWTGSGSDFAFLFWSRRRKSRVLTLLPFGLCCFSLSFYFPCTTHCATNKKIGRIRRPEARGQSGSYVTHSRRSRHITVAFRPSMNSRKRISRYHYLQSLPAIPRPQKRCKQQKERGRCTDEPTG